ncbi:nuclear transport factor 2 family protein [Gloeothece verrucosa]|uniref:SnoaL-like domain-containing protein n=1 Tax=Gloeothece verrucosa (strain PCC 7822) TaxID=497965 RepID=E0UCU6_GLOV7|nr:nuclear transport factor 2 family protein [Gloeothece verrucosa]ADN16411.1 conserved hypothetical protein [Gloeothece verrucosa PCC 7822]
MTELTQALPQTISIEGITNPVILAYFENLNREDYQAAASLFAPEGALHPPFEEPIVGAEAITAYLQAEAKGMKLAPRQGIMETLEDDSQQYQISGKVKTPLFSVNVGWKFILTPLQEIIFVEVKLLASPQELLNLRR